MVKNYKEVIDVDKRKNITPSLTAPNAFKSSKNAEEVRKKEVLARIFERLLMHPINDITRFDEISKKFKVKEIVDGKLKETVIPGLTKPLKKIMWPSYKYTAPIHGKGTGVTTSYDGIVRGKQVHQEIEIYFNEGRKELLKKYTVYELHPFTRRIIFDLQEKYKLKPLRSEVLIYDEKLRIATKIDMICTDENCNLVGIELKTGMNSYFLRGNDTMSGPLKNVVTNSPYNQASLQMLISSMILSKRYGVNLNRIAVLQVRKGETSCETMLYQIPVDITNKQDQIYDYVKTSMLKKKANKQQKSKSK